MLPVHWLRHSPVTISLNAKIVSTTNYSELQESCMVITNTALLTLNLPKPTSFSPVSTPYTKNMLTAIIMYVVVGHTRVSANPVFHTIVGNTKASH